MHHNTIEITNLSFSYPDGRLALKNLSLTIEAREKVALIGPNGAGKSTLLLHLNGLIQANTGNVQVCGIEMREKNLRAIRAAVGLVFQDPNDQLFCPTVFEDVAYAPRYQGLPITEVRMRTMDALQAVGMTTFAERSSYHLSLGEKKRIALATVLSQQPEILVLDEPSAGLDPRARRSLINLLAQIHPTLLIASHDLRLVGELCTRVVILDEGVVAADGPGEDILGDTALLTQHGLEL